VGVSGHHSVAVVDIEHWSSWSAVDAANIQCALTEIMARGAAEAGLDWTQVHKQSHGDGAILVVRDDVAKELIVDDFVEEDRLYSLDGVAPGAAAEGTRWLTRFCGVGSYHRPRGGT
jgi:hypothetical protein